MTMNAQELATELAHFCGSDTIYAHALNRTVHYTEGVRYFAKRAGAYWLLDILATEPAILRQAQEFAAVTLTVKDGKGIVKVTDGNSDQAIFIRRIDYTDCPEGQWRFFFCGQTILLPSEY